MLRTTHWDIPRLDDYNTWIGCRLLRMDRLFPQNCDFYADPGDIAGLWHRDLLSHQMVLFYKSLPVISHVF